MFALPIFAARGSDASAACGGPSEQNEWQRSARDDGVYRLGHSAGTATGILSSCRGKCPVDTCRQPHIA